VRKIFNRLFRIKGHSGLGRPTHLFRWTLLRIGWLGIDVCHFVGDDALSDMHDHPQPFISIGLKGQYKEWTPNGARIYRSPWFQSFPATHTHRITMIDGGDCWALVIHLKGTHDWGLLTSNGWVPWQTYLNRDLQETDGGEKNQTSAPAKISSG
jgi:hypothetical protein